MERELTKGRYECVASRGTRPSSCQYLTYTTDVALYTLVKLKLLRESKNPYSYFSFPLSLSGA